MPFATILDLPRELLGEITDLVAVSAQDLHRLRRVSRAFHSVATRRAFKEIRVYATYKSTRGFMLLMSSPSVTTHIQAIELSEPVRAPSELAAIDLKFGPVRRRLRDAFAMLHQLPSLRSLTFSFHPYSSEVHPFFIMGQPSRHLLLQWDVLGAMAQNPNRLPALQSLTIRSWIAVAHRLYASAPFARIVASLRHLCIMVSMNSPCLSDDAVHRTFWRRVVEQNVLLPAVNLEYLAVYCNERTLPALDFNLLAYPRLIALTLCNINLKDEDRSIAHGKGLPGVENFIVRHEKTLKKLRIRYCAIEVPKDRDTPSRSWTAIWNQLAKELTKLVDLEVVTGNDPDWGKDLPALEAFMEIVEARKSEWGSII
ncbi:hypothetical protein BJV74DRAFT_54486 [Russula compacta]|nr:hypothetical protein BJV74DRAFT_54486 [Russula compacta]